MWVKVLEIPYKILFPLILLFCLIGAYSINNVSFDLYVMILFGLVGWIMRKFGYEGAPLILAYVLGPLLENALRQSLLDFKRKFSRSLSATRFPLLPWDLLFFSSSRTSSHTSRSSARSTMSSRNSLLLACRKTR